MKWSRRMWMSASVITCGVALRAYGQAPAVASDTSPVVLEGRPQLIGPGTVSTAMAEFGGTRTPDGDIMLYTVTDRIFSRMTIVETRRDRGVWGRPEVAPFSGQWNDADAALTPDGEQLVFMSNRPMPGEPAGQPRHDFNLWRVARHGSGWGTPEPLPAVINSESSEVAPSLTASGVLYFARGGHILRAEPAGSGYGAVTELPFRGGNATVSPDEHLLVFVGAGRRQGDADLYLSCHTASGWSTPRRIAEPVSSPLIEGDPVIPPDGRTLVFASERGAGEPAAWPRPRRARYADLEREAAANVFNGLRNLYEVGIPVNVCP